MTILITGAGLIGSHLGRELQSAGEEPIYYDIAPSIPYLSTVLQVNPERVYTGDITNLPEIASILQKNKVSTIVHTAGLIGSNVSREPYRGVETNVGGSVAVAEAARLASVQRIIFCSSMAIYDFEKIPSKGLIGEESPVGPKNLYAATKLASEHLLNHYGIIYDIQILNLRLAGVYGRGQYFGGSWMGRIVNRIMEACLANRPVSVKREWLGINEYIYVKDVARALALACKSRGGAGAFNIGCGKLHSFDEFLATVQTIFPDSKINIAPSDAPPVGYLMRDQPFDVTRAKTDFGFQAGFQLQSGLQDYATELAKFLGSYPRLD